MKIKTECKGKVYKLRVTQYMDKRETIIIKKEFVLMKKLSCPGCNRCGWIKDETKHILVNDKIILHEKCQDGKLYNLGFVNQVTEYETIDNYALRFIPTSEVKDDS